MNTNTVKQALAGMLAIVAVAAATTTLARLGDLVEATGRGADPDGVLTIASSAVDPRATSWQPEVLELPRALTDDTRAVIAESYLVGLAILDGNELVGDVDPRDYLTGPALAAARNDAGSVTRRRHRLRAEFHSADGQIVEITDEAEYLLEIEPHGIMVRRESAIAVMIQIDGSWHLRHRLITDSVTSESDYVGPPDRPLEAGIDLVMDGVFFSDTARLRSMAAPIGLMVTATSGLAWLFTHEIQRRQKEE